MTSIWILIGLLRGKGYESTVGYQKLRHPSLLRSAVINPKRRLNRSSHARPYGQLDSDL